MKFYNTLTRKKETFKPIKKTEVSLYTCGPTVYNFAHIGNLRGFMFYDFLKRVLLFNNFKVKHVMNITDVGHLTSDSDQGEDKMLKGAKREKKTVWEVAEFYIDSFKRDIKKLNILKPTFFPRATDHITDQINFIEKLEKKGFTYQAGGNVYFDTSKLDDYGKLSRLDLTVEGKARVDKDPNKKNPHDFVLWFTKSKFQDQGMKWKSPFGTGYPGWHIECSAMSMKFLGEKIDIHCGGIDHIPVHHTNEIAQSEAAIGKKPWVKYWMHNEFLVLSKGEKMAKSGENFLTLSKLEEKGYSPLDYRYFCLGTSYRNPLMFSFEALDSAKTSLKRLFDQVLEIKTGKKVSANKNYLATFTKEVNDDMNTAKGLALVWELLKDGSVKNDQKYATLLEFDKVLGLGFKDLKKEKIPKEVVKLAEERLQARLAKDWKKSDDLRDKIAKFGYSVGDSKDGYELKKE
ncbi:cysteine--tRNA ligase [Candidatus Woesearchaeota archaeon]|jgi:cysteinyl-tRNA synthetase|nr:cysteine--tRNA ligase [Candidatus Woesearchaeota archaeon]MBT4335750.1 cysteine--tRNA ligase [Candidatus Woesearchaeota archaeon]MBT4469273.1 cysteine--tRNA ligase [Candidatus Woesearchaeota archaeon]MBT6402056.1 cysteine--tRNA ligase [Candidatus Woesearchaeota archaeon]MBT6744245.1 cysteine--tRNA ligase [Candidatus Woesearchaeota archaeon]